ncbi:MAG: TIR domain-containing protein [Sulfuricellaceae bacterium]
MASTQIFISYRRSDSGGHAGRLWDKLRQCTRKGALFYDKGEIDSGDDFPQAISRAVLEARAVLVLIGPDWAARENLDRLHEKDGKKDFVRREVALALTRHAAGGSVATEVIPVLLGDGAAMPEAAKLPADLASLVTLNALVFTGNDADWQNQFARLLKRLKTTPGVKITLRCRLPSLVMPLFGAMAAVIFAAWYVARPALGDARDYLRMARYDLAARELRNTPGYLAWWPGLELSRAKAQLGLDFAEAKPESEKLGVRLNKLLASHPVDPDLKVLQAAQSLREHHLQAVQIQAEAALHADPENAEAWFLRGMARDEQGDIAGATADYRKASELAPHSPQYRGNYAALLLERGAYAAAIAQYSSIPGYPLARLEEAKAHWALGDFSTAAGRQQDALEMLGNEKYQNDPYNRRAWVFYLLADQGVRLITPDEKRCYAELSLAASRVLDNGQLFPSSHCAAPENREHLRNLLADDLCRYVAAPQPGKAAAAQTLRGKLGATAACPVPPRHKAT